MVGVAFVLHLTDRYWRAERREVGAGCAGTRRRSRMRTFLTSARIPFTGNHKETAVANEAAGWEPTVRAPGLFSSPCRSSPVDPAVAGHARPVVSRPRTKRRGRHGHRCRIVASASLLPSFLHCSGGSPCPADPRPRNARLPSHPGAAAGTRPPCAYPDLDNNAQNARGHSGNHKSMPWAAPGELHGFHFFPPHHPSHPFCAIFYSRSGRRGRRATNPTHPTCCGSRLLCQFGQ